MPNTQHVYCWNHIHQNVEYHARNSLKMNEDDRRRVNTDLSAMLRSSSLENYEKRKEEFFAMDHWRPPLRDYFERRVNNDIIQRASTNVIKHFCQRVRYLCNELRCSIKLDRFKYSTQQISLISKQKWVINIDVGQWHLE
jgi:hypothetical protein